VLEVQKENESRRDDRKCIGPSATKTVASG
jgi:hypothetical protein